MVTVAANLRAQVRGFIRPASSPSVPVGDTSAAASWFGQGLSKGRAADHEVDPALRRALIDQEIDAYRQALKADPAFVPARALLAGRLGDLADLETDPTRRSALRAEEFRAYEAVVQAAPGDAYAWLMIGILLGDQAEGEHEELQRAQLRQRELSAYRHGVLAAPQDAGAWLLFGTALGRTGLELPDDVATLQHLSEAVEALRKAVSADPRPPAAWTNLAANLLHLFHRAPSQKILEEATRAAEQAVATGGGRYNLASAQALAGRVTEALANLAHALSALEVPADHVRQDPDWDALRDDPRLSALLGTAGASMAHASPREELIAHLKHQPGPEQVAESTRVNEEWGKALEVLFGDIRHWLAPVVASAQIEIQDLHVEVSEGGSGIPSYVAPALRILAATGPSVAIVPRARRVVAATGRVDMSREPRGPVRPIVRFAITPPEWHLAHKRADQSWATIPLDEDSFCRTLMELLS